MEEDMVKDTNYPTKDEILAEKPKFREGTILITKLWKSSSLKNWKNEENWVKIAKIELLIQALCILHKKTAPKILLTNEYACDIDKKEIYLDYKNPSIVSSLHETAHYIFGRSELKACRWSVWLFKECFTSSYEKLTWKGHMLVK